MRDKRISAVAAVFLGVACAWADGQKHPVGEKDPYVAPTSAVVRAKLEWLRDQKLCLMMHFGLYSQLGIMESWGLSSKDAFWSRSEAEWTKADAQYKRDYFALNRSFNPIRYDAAEIARTAKRCGFRYVTLTTKHHDGFCLYDTKLTDYKTTDPSCPYSAHPNADIVRRTFDACRAEGLGVSAYFSKVDFHHEDFWEDHGIGHFTDRRTTYDAKAHPEKWARFREFTKGQILELVRDYGPLDMLWLDGAWLYPHDGHDLGMTDIVRAARQVQPDLIAVDRGSRDENMNVATPEQTVPEKPLDYPWETCMTMAEGWGYHYDDTYKSARTLIHILVDVVAKGGNLALNVGPMPDGRLPRPALERMEAMGAWLRANGAAIYGTRATEPFSLGKCRFTRGKDGATYAIRLWGEEESGRRTGVLINGAPAQGEVKRVVHLATGREMSFSPVRGNYESGVFVDFPADFAHDPYADAFKVECK